MITSILAVLFFISFVGSIIYFKRNEKKLIEKNKLEQNQLVNEHNESRNKLVEDHEQLCSDLLNRIDANDSAYNTSIDEFEKESDLNATFHTELYGHLNSILTYMRDIDLRGAFEADDEVGSVFKDMLVAIEALKPYVTVLEPIGNDTEEKKKEAGSEKQQ